MAWRASRLARSCWPAPIACETSTVAPMSMAERIEMMKKTSSNPIPTPATAAAPRRATMNVSTAPTNVWSRFSPMIGVASVSTRRWVIGSITTGSGTASAALVLGCGSSASLVWRA